MRLIILLLCSCVANFLHSQNTDMNYLEMSGQAQSSTIEEICNRYNLKCCGSGGGAMDVVRTSHFMLNSDRKYSIAEARRILVCSMLIFAQHINSYRELRPFLIEYPFPMRDLGVTLMCASNANDSSSNPDKLGSASVIDGTIFYSERLPPSGKLATIQTESFEEALKIIQKSYPNDLQEIYKKNYTSGKKNTIFERITIFITDKLFSSPTTSNEKYKGSEESRKMRLDLDAYGQEIAKKYGMTFHRAGNPSRVSYTKVRYGLDLFDSHPKTLEESRVMTAELLKDFLTHLKTSPIIDDYHKDMNERQMKRKIHPPLTQKPDPEQVCIRIGYWDENFDRLKEPFLAQILFVEGFCNYYVAEPDTQALKLVYRESYDEAMKHLEQQKK